MRVSGRAHAAFWKAHVKLWALSRFEIKREKRVRCRNLLEQSSARILRSGRDELTWERQFNMVLWGGCARLGGWARQFRDGCGEPMWSSRL